MYFGDHSRFNEVIQFGVKFSGLGDTALVTHRLQEFILWVILEVTLEVVSVLLLFLCHISEEIGVVVCQTLFFTLLHTFLSALVGSRVGTELSRVKNLYLVKQTIEFGNRLLNFKPGLVEVTSIWNRKLDALRRHLTVNCFVSLVHGVEFLMSLLQAFKLVGWVDEDSVGLVWIHVNVDVGCWDRLHVDLGTITKHVCQVNSHVFFGNIEVGKGREHHRVVILLLTELVLKSDDFETLAADLAPVDGAFTDHVENLLVRVRIVFDTWPHTDHNTPRGVGGEDEDRVVDCTELRVNGGLHLVPLVELNRVLGERGTVRSCRVTMQAIPLRHLRPVGVTIWLNKALDVLDGCSEPVFDLFKNGEVRTGLKSGRSSEASA